MSGNVYTQITTSENFEIYQFISDGRLPLTKVVKFELVDAREQIYNLVLCTVLADGTEDCNGASRNGDMNKVLETTAQITKIFSDQYPKRKIFVTGSTIARTRQYQIKILLFYKLINEFFEIEGVAMKDFQIISRERFKPKMNYDGFILTRKNANAKL